MENQTVVLDTGLPKLIQDTTLTPTITKINAPAPSPIDSVVPNKLTPIERHESDIRFLNSSLQAMIDADKQPKTSFHPKNIAASRELGTKIQPNSGPEIHEQRAELIQRLLTGLNSESQAGIIRESIRLTDEIIRNRARVENSRGADADEVRRKYREADSETTGLSIDEKVKTRLGKFFGPRIISDFDGTMSEDPENYLFRLIPANELADPIMTEHGRDILPLMHSLYWQPLLQENADHFYAAGQYTPLRKGVNEFMEFADKNRIPLTILSTGFVPFLRGAMSQLTASEGIDLIGVTDNSVWSSDKGTIVRDFAQSDKNRAVFFLGDGSTDVPALEAKDMIACYFALAGSSFERQLQKEGALYYPYQDFNDIQSTFQGLTK